MKELTPQGSALREDPGHRPRWTWFLGAGCVLVTFIGLLMTRLNNEPASRLASTNALGAATSANSSSAGRSRLPHRPTSSEPALTAEEIVARKLSQFGKNRRELVHAIAKHFKVDVPVDVERFFDAVEGGRWEEIDTAFKSLRGEYPSSPRSPELNSFWRCIQETWGIAREAHNWPAQKLLDYGEAVLGSLRPGMVYVGGTDSGSFIPTFLNETSESEHHIVLTQNALADGTYLHYLNYLYGDRFATLSDEDSQRCFQEYLQDAQRRLQSNQLKPGEDVRIAENRIQVSGQVAVMAINEKLLQTLLQKNPDLSFALEESFSLKSTYTGAAPLGPIMELRVQDEKNALTPERAAQSLDYWRATTQRLLSDPGTPPDSDPRKAYAQMAMAQANLFADRNCLAEAEQAYRLAHELSPVHTDTVFGLSELLVRTGRADEGNQLLDDFARNNADQQSAVEKFRKTLPKPAAQPPRP